MDYMTLKQELFELAGLVNVLGKRIIPKYRFCNIEYWQSMNIDITLFYHKTNLSIQFRPEENITVSEIENKIRDTYASTLKF